MAKEPCSQAFLAENMATVKLDRTLVIRGSGAGNAIMFETDGASSLLSGTSSIDTATDDCTTFARRGPGLMM